MKTKNILLAAAMIAATVSALPATATVVTPAKTSSVYVSYDQKSFDAIRKGYKDYAFSFASGATQLADPYAVGNTGVSFGATGSLYGINTPSLNNGNPFLLSVGDLTATYTGPVLGLFLASATNQTLKFTVNGTTNGSVNLLAGISTFVGFDNGGVPLNGKTGLQVVFDGSACSDAIAVLGFQTAVPEAATWAMMMVGLGLTGASLRRRRAMTSASVSLA